MRFTVTCGSGRGRQLPVEKEEATNERERGTTTHLLADVDHLAPRLVLVELGVERLVALLVVLDALAEVALGLLGRLPVIVRVAARHLDGNVGRDDGRVGAQRLDEEELEARLALDAVGEGLAALARRVGRVCCGGEGQLGALDDDDDDDD